MLPSGSERRRHEKLPTRYVLSWIMPERSRKPKAADELTAKQPKKNPAAVALGRLGGLKGGKARAKKLSAKRRKEIAKKAAAARWGRR